MNDFVDDDEVSARTFWDALEHSFTISSSKDVENIRVKLENLSFKLEGNWEDHIARYLEIIDELGTLDHVSMTQGKVTKLLRTCRNY